MTFAFRGTRLSENDVLALLHYWIQRTQTAVETHRKYRQKKRSDESAEELAELLRQEEELIKLIREAGGKISARLHSGQAVLIHARTHSVVDICKQMQISRKSFYNCLGREKTRQAD